MQVFICYASQDQKLANQVAAALTAAGFDVWYDKSEILPGDNWGEKVSEGLKKSQAMVVLVTPAALESKEVQSSISYALGDKSYRRRLIPVFVGNVEDLPSDRMPWILKKFKSVHLSMDENNDAELNRIAQVIKDAA
jgi:hypothetical protein